MKTVKKNNSSSNSSQNLSIETSLQALFFESKELFKLLDVASETIRKLESNLIELKANFPFRFLIKEEKESSPKALPDDYKDLSCAESYATKICWYLAWESTDENTKHFRLFLISEEKGLIYYCPEGDWVCREHQSKIITKKTFIETDLQSRLRYSEHLRPFIDAFTDHLKKYRLSLECETFFDDLFF